MTGVEYVRMICKEKGIPVSKMEKDLGYGNGYFNPRKLKKIPIGKAPEIAEYLEIDVFSILSEEDGRKLLSSNNDKNNRIPIVRRVAAGVPIDSQEEIIGWEEMPSYKTKDDVYFGLKIQGNSMEPGIADGDIIICKKQDDAEDGQIIVAVIDGNDGVCKRLKKYDDGKIALMSDNPSYPPMYFDLNEIESVPIRIMGIVKELRRSF